MRSLLPPELRPREPCSHRRRSPRCTGRGERSPVASDKARERGGVLSELVIPREIRPSDGRFGAGPSKIRPEAVEALHASSSTFLGTSHRRPAVREVIGRVRDLLAELLCLPGGYEIALGNGGTTAFWDAALFGLIEQKSQHLSFGEFSSRFAGIVADCPHLASPEVITSDPGTRPEPAPSPDIDAYALTHNETSTGVAAPVRRPVGSSGTPVDGLVLVDATSAAGALRVEPAEFDVYYFAAQKALASDGGLWLAAFSPAAIERVERSSRWAPNFLNLRVAIENSRLSQTTNTPALATLFLLAEQLEWLVQSGGLEFAASRCEESAEILYGWAERSEYASPFVEKPGDRSPVTATIDLDPALAVDDVTGVLRHNGIVDTEGYRKLGRNQLRIALFPAIEPGDVEALTVCIDWVVTRLAA